MIDEFIITNLIEREDKRPFGFARRIRDAEEVFIPPRVAEANDLKMHTKIYASIVRSHLDGGCPFVIDYVYDEAGAFSALLEKVNNPCETTSPEPMPVENQVIKLTEVEIMDEVRSLVKNRDTFITTKTVTEYISRIFDHQISSQEVGRVLDRMHSAGELSAVKLNRMNDQVRASKVVYGGPIAHKNFIKLVTGE